MGLCEEDNEKQGDTKLCHRINCDLIKVQSATKETNFPSSGRTDNSASSRVLASGDMPVPELRFPIFTLGSRNFVVTRHTLQWSDIALYVFLV
ncbi:hypothetical protein B566_EDAN013642 [Ephemera danica]|nr:hypothetical protein B566_EDAN013642 [Ephemera danica]